MEIEQPELSPMCCINSPDESLQRQNRWGNELAQGSPAFVFPTPP